MFLILDSRDGIYYFVRRVPDDDLSKEMFERLRSKDWRKVDLDREVHKYIK